MKTSKVKVSVVIPIYNAEQFLVPCIDSVLVQDLHDIEVICIDDASTDQGPAILNSYCQKDERIRLIRLPENRWAGYARNVGIAEAKGKYVYFLDADDLIKPNALKELFSIAEDDKLDGVFFDADLLFEEERFRNINYKSERKGSYDSTVVSGEALFDKFYRADDWDMCVWRQFWRTDFLRENGLLFPVHTEHEDEAFSAEAILLAKRVRYVPAKYAVHRFRAGSASTRPKTAIDFQGYFLTFRELSRFKRARKIYSEAFDLNLAKMYLLMKQYSSYIRKEPDVSQWFINEKEYNDYLFFEAIESTENILNKISNTVWEELVDYKHLYIYGAGILAKRVMQLIPHTLLFVEGFLVTSLENNPDTLFHRPVTEAESWQPEKSTAVVIAAGESKWKEIIQVLSQKKCDIYYYSHMRIFRHHCVEDKR